MIKTNKLGCFTDIHIGLGQDSDTWHKIVLDFAKWASEKYLNLGINDIIICGDIFHNRSEISVSTLSIAKQFFDYFKDFQLYILAGNHDSFYKEDSRINSISIFDGWKNIKVVDKEPYELLLKDKKSFLIPWGTSYEDIPKCDILFGHFEISSFYMNTYKKCEHGMESSDLFKKANLIVSGHFHKKDHRIYDNGEIIYLGSPYQQNFGDSLDDRGIYIYDIEKNNFEFIENKISPKYYKLSLKEINKNEFNLNEFKEKIENNHVSLIVDTEIDQEKLFLLTSNIQKNSPINFRLDHLEVDSKNLKLNNAENLNSTNILEDIEKYINSVDIKNKKEVIEYITELFNNKLYE
jgi:DNA repair exonuclease SbcCD nuclease subunit